MISRGTRSAAHGNVSGKLNHVAEPLVGDEQKRSPRQLHAVPGHRRHPGQGAARLVQLVAPGIFHPPRHILAHRKQQLAQTHVPRRTLRLPRQRLPVSKRRQVALAPSQMRQRQLDPVIGGVRTIPDRLEPRCQRAVEIVLRPVERAEIQMPIRHPRLPRQRRLEQLYRLRRPPFLPHDPAEQTERTRMIRVGRHDIAADAHRLIDPTQLRRAQRAGKRLVRRLLRRCGRILAGSI